MKRFKLILLIIIFFPIKSQALIEVDITRGNLNPLPVAVSSLSSSADDKKSFEKEIDVKDIGLEISKVIENKIMKIVWKYARE